MESIYYVMCWQCHRRCVHCYEDRFHPYHGEELAQVVAEAVANAPRVLGHFPESMIFASPDGPRPGRIILSGGEVLHKAVREPVLYPALETIRHRYRDKGGVEIIVQTTGDLVTGEIVDELLARGVDRISVSGLDEYHEGLESPEAREALRGKLTQLFEAHGMNTAPGPAPSFSFFGATPGSWIGALWPRGRAHDNELSVATMEDNFCNAWSGGLKFLDYGRAGSEVSIDPDGNVYPCCIKTKKAVGNLLDEPLRDILARLAGNPVYEAINAGQPERMGLAHGWSVEKFREKSAVTLKSGQTYRNLCIGCDAFHEEVLMSPALVTIGGS